MYFPCVRSTLSSTFYLLRSHILTALPEAAYRKVPVGFSAIWLIWFSPEGIATVRLVLAEQTSPRVTWPEDLNRDRTKQKIKVTISVHEFSLKFHEFLETCYKQQQHQCPFWSLYAQNPAPHTGIVGTLHVLNE